MRGKILIIGITFVLQILFCGYVYSQEAVKPEPDSNFSYDDHSKRDPLVPLVTSSGEIVNFSSELLISDLYLEGIMFAKDENSIAIINGKLLKVNDSIGSFILKKITKYYVILSKGGKKIRLNLKRGG